MTRAVTMRNGEGARSIEGRPERFISGAGITRNINADDAWFHFHFIRVALWVRHSSVCSQYAPAPNFSFLTRRTTQMATAVGRSTSPAATAPYQLHGWHSNAHVQSPSPFRIRWDYERETNGDWTVDTDVNQDTSTTACWNNSGWPGEAGWYSTSTTDTLQ
jgi:hypothetical protein